MSDHPSFRPYSPADEASCLDLFDANCPDFFAPNERADYLDFLRAGPSGYEVCLADSRIAGAFGFTMRSSSRGSLNWILLDPRFQGIGIGSALMRRAITRAFAAGAAAIDIAASQKSAPFFAKFGAAEKTTTLDGWGAGMHRVDMTLSLGAECDSTQAERVSDATESR